MSILDKLKDLLKGAEVEKSFDPDTMKAFHSKLSSALSVYGAGDGLPADHPFHTLKALDKEMGDYISANCGTTKSEDPPVETPPAVEPPVEAPPAVEVPVVAEEPPVEKAEDPIAKRLEELEKRAKDAEEALAIEKDANVVKAHVEVLKGLSSISVNPETDGPLFKSLSETNKAAYDRVMELLRGADAVAEFSNLLSKQLGSDLPGDKTSSNTAWSRIEAEADELRKTESGKKISKHQAIDIVMKRRPDLVKQHNAEAGA